MQKIKLWFSICRPHSLFASACPVFIGLLALGELPDLVTAIITLLCALSLQILSNLINDYYDYRRGCDKAGRVGPYRALAEGIVSEKQMRNACLVALSASVLFGAYLIYTGGWIIFAIGVLSILFAWLYTATSHSLSYLGIADIFCFLFYGPIASLGTAYLQISQFNLDVFFAGSVCGCIAVCVLASNNIRDIDDDRKVGKRTIPVRFGKTFALVGVGVMIAVAFVCTLFAFRSVLVASIILPATFIYIKLLRASGQQYTKCLVLFGLLNAVYVVLVTIEMCLRNWL